MLARGAQNTVPEALIICFLSLSQNNNRLGFELPLFVFSNSQVWELFHNDQIQNNQLNACRMFISNQSCQLRLTNIHLKLSLSFHQLHYHCATSASRVPNSSLAAKSSTEVQPKASFTLCHIISRVPPSTLVVILSTDGLSMSNATRLFTKPQDFSCQTTYQWSAKS